MNRSVSFAQPREPVAFDGERCTPWVTTQIHAAHMHRYLSTLSLCHGKRVLDIASGEGYGSAMLIRNGAAKVTGAEIDGEAVARANRVYAHEGLAFVQADAARPLPFADGSFDVVLSFETLEHIAEQEALVAELARVLTPEGTLVISTPDRQKSDPDAPNPFHVRELDQDEFLALLRTSFPTVRLYQQGYNLGSVIRGPEEHVDEFWNRTGFIEYEEDGGARLCHYFIAVASQSEGERLSSGHLHDQTILSSLNRRIRELEAQVSELKQNGAG